MFEFPYEDEEKYSCWCSGGADSSLVLYYLMKSGKPVDVYTASVPKLGNKNSFSTAAVIDKCIELTGNTKVNHNVIYQPDKDERSLIFMTMPLYEAGLIKRLYTGITANPPEDATKLKSDETQVRDPNVTRDINPYPWVTTPFTNYDKKFLASLYKEEGILDELFPLTHSCEYFGDPEFDPGMEHCGECWWCQERQWAFGRLK